MSAAPLKTALVGFGRIAAGYADDPAMARYYRYATHAQVLAAHDAFELVAAVDPEPHSREAARTRWGAAVAAADAAQLGSGAAEVEVLVLATPPDARLSALDAFPNVKAVLVEKPLGTTIEDSARFVEACRARGVLVQVNLWRRADERFRALAAGELARLVGTPQGACGIYGNGVLNNGVHMVDFVRMLLGEVEAVQAIGRRSVSRGPLPGDTNPAFALELAGGAVASFLPVDFADYRENGLDVWGSGGRLAIQNEGLTLLHYPRRVNRATTGEHEIACDEPTVLASTVGEALYHLYTNVAEALRSGAPLVSPADSALRSTLVVEAIRCSQRDGRAILRDEMSRWLAVAATDGACT